MPPEQIDEELAERGRLLIAAAVQTTQAPLALRERIEADRGRPRRRSRSWRVLAPATGLVVAAVVAVVLFVGGSTTNPTVFATAALAAKGPVLPAPPEDPANDNLLKASVEGVPFPYWGGSFQWTAIGARQDKLKGRNAKTVFYANPKGVRAAYTILGGSWIDPPAGATVRHENGTKLWVTEKDGRRIVTWKRGGHACVLSAPVSVPQDKLLKLASWTAKGKVPF